MIWEIALKIMKKHLEIDWDKLEKSWNFITCSRKKWKSSPVLQLFYVQDGLTENKGHTSYLYKCSKLETK